MAFKLKLNESTASLRAVPMWLVGSDGTSPATGESGSTFFFQIGGADYGSGGSLSAVSVGGGHYVCAFAASKISVVGPGVCYYRSANALPSATPIEVVRYDSYNSQDFGLAAFSEVSIHAGTHSGVTIKGLQNYANISNVTLHAGTHSDVTIKGIQNYANISSVTLMAGEYSNVTVRLGAGSYSGVTVEVSNFGRSSMQSMADRVLLRALASGSDAGRTVQDALRVLRNKVAIDGSTMTVFTEDDSSSAWTASVSTSASASPIISVDPGGP